MNLIKKISSTLIATVLGVVFISNVNAAQEKIHSFMLLERTNPNHNIIRTYSGVAAFASGPYEKKTVWWGSTEYNFTVTSGRKILAATGDMDSLTWYSIVKDGNKKCFISDWNQKILWTVDNKNHLTETCIPMSNDKQANQTVGLVYDGNDFIEQEYSPKNNVSYFKRYKTWAQLVTRKPSYISTLKNNFNKENIYHGIAYEKNSRGQGYYTILCKMNGNFFVILGRNIDELRQFSQLVENRIKAGKQNFIYLDKSKEFQISSTLSRK